MQQESESAFRELLELSPDAVVLNDAELRIIDANSAACRLLGYERDELLAKSGHDLVQPEGVSTFVRELSRLPGRVHVGEWSVKRSDGTSVPVEASIKVLTDGRALSFLRDITERKRAEIEREEFVSWLSAVLEQCPVGLALVHGARGERLEANVRLRELLGEDIGEPSVHMDLRSKVRSLDGEIVAPEQIALARVLNGERLVRTEFLVPNASGSTSHVSISAAPILGRDGHPVGAVMTCEDVTAEKELERLRAEWSSVVAHDLRQPLASISLFAQALTRATRDEPVLKSAEQIVAAANRLTRMVGDLMDLSRLDAHRLELLRQPVSVPALVRAAVERLQLQTSDRRFDVQVRDDVPVVLADPDRIAQVLENLLTNAVKYGRAGTPIAVAVDERDGEIAVSVTNHGTPLAPDELSRLFERFQRSESAKQQRIKGTGLGLYITRSLVEAHGGRIALETPSNDRISFRFTLPAA